MATKKIGIYGGTFSPPHMGHVGAAKSFVEKAELDELLIMPDFLPPHKEYDGNVTAEDRLEMARIAFSGIKNSTVSDMEIKRGGKSYTSVTLEELSGDDRELYFLCGTDMFLTLEEWYRAPLIFSLATICYVRRESDKEITERIEKLTSEYKKKYGARIIAIETDVLEISSSELRSYLKNDPEKASNYIPHGVYKYISDRGLYR